jgi:hypothetical protein
VGDVLRRAAKGRPGGGDAAEAERVMKAAKLKDWKKEEARQIEAIVKLIDPSPEREADCRAELTYRLRSWGFDGATFDQLYRLPTKERRKAVSRLLAACERLEASAKPFMRDTALFGGSLGWSLLFRPHIADVKKRCKTILAGKPGKPRRQADKQRWAAQQAFDVVRDFGRPSMSMTIRLLTKVAAEFYGPAAPDMTKYCRAVCARLAKQGSK